MPRPPRLIFSGHCYHVINRANQKAQVFHCAADYRHFIDLIRKAQTQVELPILAACLMPNHVHLVVRPASEADVTKWMHWLFTTHSRHYNDQYEKVGHVWQGRFKASLAQTDHHLLTVIRYVERNALRAKLVGVAEAWPWGSLYWRLSQSMKSLLAPCPVDLPPWWRDFVNQPQTSAELEAIRTSVNRQRPFGDDGWVQEKAREADLQQSLNPTGRPRKRKPGTVS